MGKSVQLEYTFLFVKFLDEHVIACAGGDRKRRDVKVMKRKKKNRGDELSIVMLAARELDGYKTSYYVEYI